MNARYLAIAGGSLLLLGASVLPAFAATTATAMSGSANATATTGITTGLSGTVSGAVNSTMGSTTVTTQTSTTSTITTQVNVGGNTANDTAGLNASVSLMSSDPSVVDFSGTSAPTASDAAMVQTSDQLNTYAAGMMHADPNIQSVQTSNAMVAVSYKKQGKLFGFIPTSITEQGEVKSDGTVSLNYPWYHFLVSTNDNASAQSNLQAEVQPLVTSSASTGFSAQTQAQIMADLYGSMSGSAS